MKEKALFLDLSGEWGCRMDQNEIGEEECWYEKKEWSEGRIINLPSTTTQNAIGKPAEIIPKWDKVTLNGLKELYHYEGIMWYRKTFQCSKGKEEKKYELFLERIIFCSKIWLDGKFLGSCDSLSTPHRFDITDALKKDTEHVLVVQIDNRDKFHLGRYASAYTNETQTIWNGIIGRIGIYEKESIKITSFYSSMDSWCEKITLHFIMELQDKELFQFKNNRNLFGIVLEDHLHKHIFLEEKNLKCSIKKILPEEDTEVSTDFLKDIISPINETDKKSNSYEIELMFTRTKSIELWDEHNPVIYSLNLKYGETSLLEMKTGFRSIEAKDKKIVINGKQRFFRGTLNCCMYPKTGYPPMDKSTWISEFAKIKEYGFNHVRFHSYCPPEAAFEAADETGLYLQIEGPVWLDNWMDLPLGKYKEHYEYIQRELLLLLREYEMHPSFCVFSNGNECNGDLEFLHAFMKKQKKHNANLLYTTSSNWDRTEDEVDDMIVCETVDKIGIRGQYEKEHLAVDTQFDYQKAMEKRKAPIISHEIGQYAVYPDITEIKKYYGVLYPLNLMTIKKDLEEKCLVDMASEYVKASTERALMLYKFDVEAALRTEHMGGFQMLALSDFMGQGTACTGLLNTFMEPKAHICKEKILPFLNHTVILLKLPGFFYTYKERVTFELCIFHYAATEYKNVIAVVRAKKKNAETIFEKEYEIDSLPIGFHRIKEDGFFLQDIQDNRTEVEICAYLKRKDNVELSYTNTWNIWGYARKNPLLLSEKKEKIPSFLETEHFDEKTKVTLLSGGKVFLMLDIAKCESAVKGTFYPVFWSPVFFESKDTCGTMIDTRHPLFEKYFPTNPYGSEEWKNILEHAYACPFSANLSAKPMVEFVPNFSNNQRNAMLFELAVGQGSILICFMDLLTYKEQYIQVQAFYEACISYVESKDFKPKQQLSVKVLENMLPVSE